MQSANDGADAFEVALVADASTEKTSALNHNFSRRARIANQRFFQAASQTCQTETVVLLRPQRRYHRLLGQKLNPGPMKMVIRGHPLLVGALIVGQGKSRAALLVEPKPNAELPDHAVIEKIWPLVEQADLPTQGRQGISREDILIVGADRSFVGTGKGTVIRKRTQEVYADEMKAFYDGLNIKDEIECMHIAESNILYAKQ